jgi:diacylglycerol O-acyltransferase
MERLTAADLSMVWPEDFGWPEDIGALAILDGSRLLRSDASFPIELMRKLIGGRLHLLPRFRQLLYMPRKGLGWPLWVDAHSMDLAEHIGVFPVPSPAGEEELLLACEELRRRRLDRSRPLWQMWFLPGLPGRRIGLFMKLHHSVADGMSGVAAFGAFLDFSADAPQLSAPPWTPAPAPSSRDLFEDNLRQRVRGLKHTVSKLVHPGNLIEQARRAWPAVRETFAEGPAPRTSLNRPIGSRRRLAIVRTNLALIKEIGHAHGGKANDVLLAAVSGGLRDLLRNRGERVDGVVLRAFVPVSLHGGRQAHGNVDGAMIVPLPIGEPDHVRRLRLIAAETAVRKRRSRPPAGTLFRNGMIQRAFLRHAVRQRFMNQYVANVPGPPVPLYLAGAEILEVFPVVPILGNMTLGVGALSYAGQFNVTAVADADTCPDIGAFIDGVQGSLEALARAEAPGRDRPAYR